MINLDEKAKERVSSQRSSRAAVEIPAVIYYEILQY